MSGLARALIDLSYMEGVMKTAEEIAKNMILADYSDEQIIQLIDLSKEHVWSLREEIKQSSLKEERLEESMGR